VGTHEQPFDRLVKELDRLAEKEMIDEEVFIQTGYSTYIPRFCAHEVFVSFDDMLQKIDEARIVVTHGGPGSIMSVLYHGKIPVAVPRQKVFSEHVDDHQVRFVQTLEKNNSVIAVYDISELESAVKDYDEKVSRLEHADKRESDKRKKVRQFEARLDELCRSLLTPKKTKK